MVPPFVYHARFEPGDERGIVVTFPDVPEAITEGGDETEARAMAEEALPSRFCPILSAVCRFPCRANMAAT